MNSIGIDQKSADSLTASLNRLLANYQVFYMNVRGFHWNIKGDKFFELHLKFEELYDDLIIKIDEIAERILTLEGEPLHTYSAYLKFSVISEEASISNGVDAVNTIVDSFKALLLQQREILILSDKARDEGTNALMSDYIREQEKLVWMYRSFLS